MSTSLRSILGVLALGCATVVSAGGPSSTPTRWTGPSAGATHGFSNSLGDYSNGLVDPADMVYLDEPGCGGAGTSCPLGAGSITQSCDCTVVPGTGVSCNGGGIATQNQYLRRFDIAGDYPSEGLPYTVTSVEFGIEVCNANTLLTANIYEVDPAAPMAYAFFNPVGSGSITATPADAGGTVVIPVAAVVNSPNHMVVEIVQSVSGAGFWPGANGLGQSGPSYIAATDCGIADPLDLAGLGFPLCHYVMIVNGGGGGGGVEDCSNGVDDDCDGDIDCADSDCFGDPACAVAPCDLDPVLDAIAAVEGKLDLDVPQRFDGVDAALQAVETKLDVDVANALTDILNRLQVIQDTLDALDLSSFDARLCEIIRLLHTPQGLRSSEECGGHEWRAPSLEAE